MRLTALWKYVRTLRLSVRVVTPREYFSWRGRPVTLTCLTCFAALDAKAHTKQLPDEDMSIDCPACGTKGASVRERNHYDRSTKAGVAR